MNKQLLKRVVHIASVAAFVVALAVMPALTQQVFADTLQATPASRAGYIDHSYGGNVKVEPTADTTESKVWYNDGIWWAVMFNASNTRWEIYRLDWATQNWSSTGLEVDTRYDTADLEKVGTRHDVLWDNAAGKLYIASHIRVLNASRVNTADQRGWLSRYSYNSGTKTYTIDANYPVVVSDAKTEAMVFDKDASGRLWVTYVSRNPSTDNLHRVYINASAGNDHTWETPVVLNVDAAAVQVHQMDISTLIPFGNNIGVMWSNSRVGQGKFYFAWHSNSTSNYNSGWTLEEVSVPGVPLMTNDHIKLLSNDAGQVFAAIKTSNVNNGEPLIGLLTRDTDGTWRFAAWAPVESQDTRPSLAINRDTNTAYLFATSNATGGVVCVKSAAIPANLAALSFPTGSCTTTGGPADAPLFIADATVNRVDNLTTPKRPFTNASGVVGIASDDVNGSVYVHNVIGGSAPPPPPPPGDNHIFMPVIFK